MTLFGRAGKPFIFDVAIADCAELAYSMFIQCASQDDHPNETSGRILQASRGKIRTVIVLIAFCTGFFVLSHNAAAQDQGRSQSLLAAIDCSVAPTLLHYPVYRIPLRVHLGKSARSPEEFKPILREINDIWLSQAGICFEMQIVLDDKPIEEGMDIWFLPVLPGGPGLNGYFRGDHNIQVRDTPILGPSARPAHSPAARTAAHECGHGLSLMHRQDSDDNLMRSKTYGWQLNGLEVQEARSAATEKALGDTAPRSCGEPAILSGSESSSP